MTKNDELYTVILSDRGNEEITFITYDLSEANRRCDELRRECRRKDPDGAIIDCYVLSESQAKKNAEAKAIWDTLTEEEKHDYIEVDGRTFIRKIYEINHKGDEKDE